MILVTAGALLFRVPRLDQRPMHTDEAVHAVKAGILIETGRYTYDAREYHGPTIYYAALPLVWLRGEKDLADTDEWTFRIVPVLFGAGLILLLLLTADGLGRCETLCGAVLTAISPAMVYYSRYYIQEMLLVFFTFGVMAAGWRYLRSKRIGWALIAGVGVGLAAATKETWVLTFGAMILSAFLTVIWHRWRTGEPANIRHALNGRHLVIAAGVALLVAELFVTGFFTNPRGAIDLFLTYLNYVKRSGGAGIHDHPWHYYLRMLLYTKYGSGPWWSEGLILALAAVGLGAVLRKPPGAVSSAPSDPARSSLRPFLAFYTVVLTVVYAGIPYKTPWCMLQFFQPMILLAGIGAMAIIKRAPGHALKAVVGILLVLAAVQLGHQAYRANFKFYADPRNPYIYGHTSTNLLRLVQRFEDLANVATEGRGILVKVITPDPWPLPWYLRRFARVGYWVTPIDDPDAPLVVTSPELQADVENRLHGQYQTEYYGLRPEVLITVLIREDLWDAFMKTRSAPHEASEP
jgi:uncharacterized protein (TIGR03663 family)